MLLCVLAASSVTLWLIVRRATSHRQWVALSEWARENGFRFSRAATGEPPGPFGQLRNPPPVVRLQLSRGPTTLVQFEHGVAAAAPSEAAPVITAAPTAAPARQPVVWNELVRGSPSNS